jgi:anti-sigma regulatory factor (Ser/Thr protein kinase)
MVPEMGKGYGVEKLNGTSGGDDRSVLDMHLARTPRAPREARRSLEALRHRIDPGVFDDVRLLVSELVTNSVQHEGPDPRSWVEVRLRVSAAAVRGEVTNPGPGFHPEPRPPRQGQESGRGLYLVDQLANRWGVSKNGVTRVWFEIAASS